MLSKEETTFWVKIYLSGDLDIIKQVCRKYCKEIGLCVTVNPTVFIYTGGEEYGVEIGLINYPRFPDTEESLYNKALQLASICRDEAEQFSYLVMTPHKTIWNTTREQ